MARTDILDKALSMTADALQGNTGRGRVFGDAMLRTLSGAGDFHETLTIPVYPRDAQRRDLENIGKTMYGALGKHATPSQG